MVWQRMTNYNVTDSLLAWRKATYSLRRSLRTDARCLACFCGIDSYACQRTAFHASHLSTCSFHLQSLGSSSTWRKHLMHPNTQRRDFSSSTIFIAVSEASLLYEAAGRLDEGCVPLRCSHDLIIANIAELQLWGSFSTALLIERIARL